MARCDALHLQVLRRVTRELQHLGGEVLKDRGCVDGGRGADALLARYPRLEETVDTTDRELRVGLGEEGRNVRARAEG